MSTTTARGTSPSSSWSAGTAAGGVARRAVARRAARLLFARHPGEWTLSFDRNNAPATALWRSVVAEVATGGITETERPPPIAGSRLRFTV
jgi:hypothetical protein